MNTKFEDLKEIVSLYLQKDLKQENFGLKAKLDDLKEEIYHL